MTVKVSMLMEIEDSHLDDLSKITHHIDYLIDMDNWSDIIKSVSDVKIEKVEEGE